MKSLPQIMQSLIHRCRGTQSTFDASRPAQSADEPASMAPDSPGTDSSDFGYIRPPDVPNYVENGDGRTRYVPDGPRAPVRKRLEKYVANWVAIGRGDQGLLDGWELIAINCWGHPARKHVVRLSDDERQFITRSFETNRAEYDGILSERHVCRCGERSRLENISLCCDCYSLLCWNCMGYQRKDAKGEVPCPCGGVYVG